MFKKYNYIYKITFLCLIKYAAFISNLGSDRDSAAHWHSGSYHGVLVSHQPHCNTSHGTIHGLALPRYHPQLLHLERQPRA